ncbi:hypothetical protein C7B61_00350 [filamentous cyanobacterium CCP1]|nr:hypothetical protein C7B76_16710 [filamentous cyanobacterium CCP2]PSB68547.1 hypothetical protein C7B61_00350 [filamentous cyanobacterium CCP1]
MQSEQRSPITPDFPAMQNHWKINFHSGLLREAARNIYVSAIIALIGFGAVEGKPEAIFTGSTLGLMSTTRKTVQLLKDREFDRKMKAANQDFQDHLNLLSEKVLSGEATIARLNADNSKLMAGLRENYHWHQQYQQARAEADELRAGLLKQLGELSSQKGDIEIKLRQAEQKLQEWETCGKEWEISESKLKAELQTYRKPYEDKIAELKEAVKHYKSQLQKTIDEFNAAVDRNAELTAKINYLELQLASLLAPKKLGGDLDINKMADSLVDWFQIVSIPLDAEGAIVEGSDWKFTFRLHKPADRVRIGEYSHALKIDFSLPTKPSIQVAGDDRIIIRAHRSESEKQSKYLRLDDEWLSDAFILPYKGEPTTHHCRFMGSSMSGKSTLIANAIGCIIQNVPKAEIILADPLVNGESNWDTLKPKYVGEEECLRGFYEFYESFKSVDRGEAPKGNVRIFLLDEFDRMGSSYPEILPMVKDIWKRGRHAFHYLWSSGQSPLVGEFRLNINDMSNVIGLYLSQTIERGLSDASETPDFKARLREEWLLAKRREPYICLCKPGTPQGKLFLAVMPKPGAYALGASVRSAAEIVEQAEEEDRLDYYSAEFDIDQTRENLESLLKSPQPEPAPTQRLINGLTRKELGQVKRLLNQGLKVSEVVKQVWNLKPSGKGEYPNRKKQVEAVQKMTNEE